MKKLKKIFKSLFACALASTTILNGSIQSVNASGYTLNVDTPYGLDLSASDKWAIGTNSNSYGYDVYAKLSINGQKVYCIQQNSLTINGAGDYSPEVLGTYTGNAALTKKLEYISTLGYGFDGDYSDEMDFATQIRIWQEMGLGSVTNIHQDIQNKINQINDRLNVMYKDVSFANQQIVLHGYGKEFAQTLTDTNGVLQYYKDYSVSGLHSQRNGNALTVWAEKGDSLKANLKYDCFYLRSQTGTSLAYVSGSSQNVALLSGIDPKEMSVNVRVQLGTIQLTKLDFETDSVSQGDATLKGATFEVVDDKTGISVGTLVSDANGLTNKLEDLPTDRTYTIREVQAPVGYRLNEESKIVDFSTIGTNEETIKNYSDKFKDRVKTGSIEIRKVNTDGQQSEITEPEKNAEFIVMLKKYVEQYGSVEEAYKHKDYMSNREYDYLTTDKDGNAYSKQLAFGKYVVKQVKGNEETEMLKNTFECNIDEQDKHFAYTINNVPLKYYVKLVKKDKATGKNVTLTSASFKIKDSKGNYVTMKVGSKKYDTFTTSSKGGVGLFNGSYYDGENKKGEVITPLTLKAGKYTVEEIKIPDGFLDTNPIEFTIQKDYVSKTDEDPTIEVVIENEQPVGKLVVKKSIQTTESDKSFIDSSKLEGISFTLSAKEDVVSAIDGTMVYKANQLVGTYTTDKNGNIEVGNLPLGHYVLKETQTLDGLVKDESEYDVVFEQKDKKTKEYVIKKQIKNDTTKVEVSKKSVTGEDELEGAHLVVTDKDGKIVDEWDSTNKPHLIEGLTVNSTYTLTETIAPEKYTKVVSIEFKIDNTGKVQKVEMIDKQVLISKKDQLNQYVMNAKLQIVDENGKVIDEWKTKDTDHMASGLEVGKQYTLKEVDVPENYRKADDITFVVKDDQKNQIIEMLDLRTATVSITKYDATNKKELPGAKLKVLNKDNEVVDEWTSTNQEHLVNNLVVGDEYTLEEETSPNGYKKAESIKFTVEDDGKVIQKVAMYDECIPNVNTGVSDHRTLFETLGVLSVGAILIMASFKKKHGKSK